MSNKEFLVAFTKTMIHEGGYSFDQLDPGGETYIGISRVHWPNWSGWAYIDKANRENKPLLIEPMLPQLVRTFYLENFWYRIRGDELSHVSEPIAEEVFDTAVNHGVHAAVRYLQQALNLLNDNQNIYPDIIEDGIIGRITMSTLQLFLVRRPMPEKTKEKMLLNVMNTLQGMHYVEQMRKFPEKERFRGWFMRV